VTARTGGARCGRAELSERPFGGQNLDSKSVENCDLRRGVHMAKTMRPGGPPGREAPSVEKRCGLVGPGGGRRKSEGATRGQLAGKDQVKNPEITVRANMKRVTPEQKKVQAAIGENTQGKFFEEPMSTQVCWTIGGA